MQTEIHFNQAVSLSETKRIKDATDRIADAARFAYLIEEIEESNPTFLSGSDFSYYAGELTDTDPSGKVWTANQVREKMMESNPDIDRYDLIDTFDFETDDIIDFF